MGEVVEMKKEELKLTPEEMEAIEAKRKQDEAIKLCAEEVNAVLLKHGMSMQVIGNPQIVIVPARG